MDKKKFKKYFNSRLTEYNKCEFIKTLLANHYVAILQVRYFDNNNKLEHKILKKYVVKNFNDLVNKFVNDPTNFKYDNENQIKRIMNDSELGTEWAKTTIKWCIKNGGVGIDIKIDNYYDTFYAVFNIINLLTKEKISTEKFIHNELPSITNKTVMKLENIYLMYHYEKLFTSLTQIRNLFADYNIIKINGSSMIFYENNQRYGSRQADVNLSMKYRIIKGLNSLPTMIKEKVYQDNIEKEKEHFPTAKNITVCNGCQKNKISYGYHFELDNLKVNQHLSFNYRDIKI